MEINSCDQNLLNFDSRNLVVRGYEDKLQLIQHVESRCNILERQLDHLRAMVIGVNLETSAQKKEITSKDEDFAGNIKTNASKYMINDEINIYVATDNSSPHTIKSNDSNMHSSKDCDTDIITMKNLSYVTDEMHQTDAVKTGKVQEQLKLKNLKGNNESTEDNKSNSKPRQSARKFINSSLKINSNSKRITKNETDKCTEHTKDAFVSSEPIINETKKRSNVINKCDAVKSETYQESSTADYFNYEVLNLKESTKANIHSDYKMTQRVQKISNENVKKMENFIHGGNITNKIQKTLIRNFKKSRARTADRNIESNPHKKCKRNKNLSSSNIQSVISVTSVPTTNFKIDDESESLSISSGKRKFKRSLSKTKPYELKLKNGERNKNSTSLSGNSKHGLETSSNLEYQSRGMLDNESLSEVFNKNRSAANIHKINHPRAYDHTMTKTKSESQRMHVATNSLLKVRMENKISDSTMRPMVVTCTSKESGPLNVMVNRDPHSNSKHNHTENITQSIVTGGEIVKPKERRNGFAQHTTSSSLKMLHKFQFHGFHFKYPFVAGKSTTPSHNLALKIQQTLSIIKMKIPVSNSCPTLVENYVNSNQFSSSINSDEKIRSMSEMDKISSVITYSSPSVQYQCPLIIQNSNSNFTTNMNIQGNKDWLLSQEIYGDAREKRCHCYPHNCINYNKIFSQYLEKSARLSYMPENLRESLVDQQRNNYRDPEPRKTTARVRLTKILHQVRAFQEMLNGRVGICIKQ